MRNRCGAYHIGIVWPKGNYISLFFFFTFVSLVSTDDILNLRLKAVLCSYMSQHCSQLYYCITCNVEFILHSIVLWKLCFCVHYLQQYADTWIKIWVIKHCSYEDLSDEPLWCVLSSLCSKTGKIPPELDVLPCLIAEVVWESNDYNIMRTNVGIGLELESLTLICYLGERKETDLVGLSHFTV